MFISYHIAPIGPSRYAYAQRHSGADLDRHSYHLIAGDNLHTPPNCDNLFLRGDCSQWFFIMEKKMISKSYVFGGGGY